MTTAPDDLLEDLMDEKDDQSGSDDLFEAHKIVADKGQSPIRLDRFLTDRLPKVSRNKVQNAIRFGSVLVDNQVVKPNHKLRPGEEISVILPRASEEDYSVLPQDIPLNIVYEDDDVMVINKPANFAVHPGVGIPNGTLVNAVAWHLKHAPPPTMPGNDESRAGIVHRIDKDTTGLMIVAKNEFSMAHLFGVTPKPKAEQSPVILAEIQMIERYSWFFQKEKKANTPLRTIKFWSVFIMFRSSNAN
jgi:23S rRNA pseudouridine1911/1915/1917 synthase